VLVRLNANPHPGLLSHIEGVALLNANANATVNAIGNHQASSGISGTTA
jgi:hypothetical protein